MKVKYSKSYTDEYGDNFQPGWVAEHTDSEGQRRIDLGVCIEVNSDARAFKYKLGAALSIDECVPPAQPDPAPVFEGAKAVKSNK
jgi:hypothetical protein